MAQSPRRHSPRLALTLIAVMLAIYVGHQIYSLTEIRDFVVEQFEAPSLTLVVEPTTPDPKNNTNTSQSLSTSKHVDTTTTTSPDEDKDADKIVSTRSPTKTSKDIDLPLWETSLINTKLPTWMKDYFAWHAQQRQTWNESNWESYRYLIMTCQEGQKCGGTADRLRPFLALLRLAAHTGRIFLIHWNPHNPALLENFLLPPQGGLDWRVPEWFLEKSQSAQHEPDGNLKGIIQKANGVRYNKVLLTKYQSPSYGATYYDETINMDINVTATNEVEELPMNEVFAYAWRVLFTPAPPIAQQIQDHLDKLQLVPGQYSSVHVRTYSIEPGKKDAIKNNDNNTIDQWHRMVRNGIRCGAELQPGGGPLYFASDAPNASRWAIDYGTLNNASVKARLPDSTASTPSHPVHLGFAGSSNTTSAVSVLYDIFVDLYLLSMGRCVTWGGGGFGQWAYLLSSPYADSRNRSSNSGSCGFRHGKRGKQCTWEEATKTLGESTGIAAQTDEVPLFSPPMMDLPR